MMNNDFKDVVFNRHSVKVFDETHKIPKELMNQILMDATSAPSSVNLQPWRMIVVESDEAKKKLRPLIRFNTRQNDTSSAMILIFGDMQCVEKVDHIYDLAVEQDLMPKDVRDELVGFIKQAYGNASKQKMNDIVKIDCSLMAMQLMLVARSYGYDTNAIGGFEEDQLARAFGLDEKRFVPVMILAIGKANYEPHKSVRMDINEIVEYK